MRLRAVVEKETDLRRFSLRRPLTNTPAQRREYNEWLNAVSKLAYKIAGDKRAFYALPRVRRLELREQAKLLHELGADFGTAQRAENSVLHGFVYVIFHPQLRGVKIGRAYDAESRLRGYQTGCPERAYQLHYAKYFEDCRTAEAAIHERLSSYALEGEWFALSPDEAVEAIEAHARRTQ